MLKISDDSATPETISAFFNYCFFQNGLHSLNLEQVFQRSFILPTNSVDARVRLMGFSLLKECDTEPLDCLDW